MNLDKKCILWCVIIQLLLLCEVHLVPDGAGDEAEGDAETQLGLGSLDTKLVWGDTTPAKKIRPTIPDLFPSQPMSANLTSAMGADRNDSEAAMEPAPVPVGNQTAVTSDMTNKISGTVTNVNVTSEGAMSGGNGQLAVTGDDLANVMAGTVPDMMPGNMTGDNITDIGVDEETTTVPTLTPTAAHLDISSDLSGVPERGDFSPSEGFPFSRHSTSIPATLHATLFPVGSQKPTITPPPATRTTLLPFFHIRTTTDITAAVKTTLARIMPSSTLQGVSRTTQQTTLQTTTRKTITTTRQTSQTRRLSTHTPHHMSRPVAPQGGGLNEELGVGERGEIAGMDPLALGIGICIPILLITVVILSVFCYRKYKKGGRGYITLDDFGTFEGMQNPNYDGEL